MSEEKLPKLGNRTYHLKGFTITRKMEFEGDKADFTNILREVAEVIDEMDLDGNDVSSVQLTNNSKVELKIQLVEKRN